MYPLCKKRFLKGHLSSMTAFPPPFQMNTGNTPRQRDKCKKNICLTVLLYAGKESRSY